MPPTPLTVRALSVAPFATSESPLVVPVSVTVPVSVKVPPLLTKLPPTVRAPAPVTVPVPMVKSLEVWKASLKVCVPPAGEVRLFLPDSVVTSVELSARLYTRTSSRDPFKMS